MLCNFGGQKVQTEMFHNWILQLASYPQLSCANKIIFGIILIRKQINMFSLACKKSHTFMRRISSSKLFGFFFFVDHLSLRVIKYLNTQFILWPWRGHPKHAMLIRVFLSKWGEIGIFINYSSDFIFSPFQGMMIHPLKVPTFLYRSLQVDLQVDV